MNQIGIDISNDFFDCTMQHGDRVVRRQFSNTPADYRQFAKWGLRQATAAQVCMESTGVYHLQLALHLDEHPDFQVMLVNPCAAQQDIQAHIKQLQRRLQSMKTRASQVIGRDEQLAEDVRIIDTAPGFAELSATKLLAELSPLPDDMRPEQWVAHAGMDPRPSESGTSMHPPRHISKQGNARIRAALFMPALVAVQHDPNVKAYYQNMLARGKPKMLALNAVMRRQLHALWGMLHHRQDWDGEKFYQLNRPNTA